MGVVYGVAYRVSNDKAQSVLHDLDYREKGGYMRCVVNVCPLNNKHVPIQALVYMATPDSVEYMPYDTDDQEETDRIAQLIMQCVGPSGANKEYLYNLATFVNNLGVQDDYLLDLEARVKLLETQAAALKG
eukprot:Platyproteum_vivax@DN17229_c0_g1_i1.p1